MSEKETINIIRVSDSLDVCEYRIRVSRCEVEDVRRPFTRIEIDEIRQLLLYLGWPSEKCQDAIGTLEKRGQFLAWGVSVPDGLLNEMGLR